eukprot:GHVT01048054.1.p1 GENE.GHVT01048054.1~~GHVT01048054.1.p1  ORF type:complete len:846 (+),score=149.77 GHVT01048054.1:2688-5225(+)
MLPPPPSKEELQLLKLPDFSTNINDTLTTGKLIIGAPTSSTKGCPEASTSSASSFTGSRGCCFASSIPGGRPVSSSSSPCELARAAVLSHMFVSSGDGVPRCIGGREASRVISALRAGHGRLQVAPRPSMLVGRPTIHFLVLPGGGCEVVGTSEEITSLDLFSSSSTPLSPPTCPSSTTPSGCFISPQQSASGEFLRVAAHRVAVALQSRRMWGLASLHFVAFNPPRPRKATGNGEHNLSRAPQNMSQSPEAGDRNKQRSLASSPTNSSLGTLTGHVIGSWGGGSRLPGCRTESITSEESHEQIDDGYDLGFSALRSASPTLASDDEYEESFSYDESETNGSSHKRDNSQGCGVQLSCRAMRNAQEKSSGPPIRKTSTGTKTRSFPQQADDNDTQLWATGLTTGVTDVWATAFFAARTCIERRSCAPISDRSLTESSCSPPKARPSSLTASAGAPSSSSSCAASAATDAFQTAPSPVLLQKTMMAPSGVGGASSASLPFSFSGRLLRSPSDCYDFENQSVKGNLDALTPREKHQRIQAKQFITELFKHHKQNTQDATNTGNVNPNDGNKSEQHSSNQNYENRNDSNAANIRNASPDDKNNSNCKTYTTPQGLLFSSFLPPDPTQSLGPLTLASSPLGHLCASSSATSFDPSVSSSGFSSSAAASRSTSGPTQPMSSASESAAARYLIVIPSLKAPRLCGPSSSTRRLLLAATREGLCYDLTNNIGTLFLGVNQKLGRVCVAAVDSTHSGALASLRDLLLLLAASEVPAPILSYRRKPEIRKLPTGATTSRGKYPTGSDSKSNTSDLTRVQHALRRHARRYCADQNPNAALVKSLAEKRNTKTFFG